jgi:hypothetical protein
MHKIRTSKKFRATVFTMPFLCPTVFALQKKSATQIATEQALIESSKQLIDVFTKKMQSRTNEIGG